METILTLIEKHTGGSKHISLVKNFDKSHNDLMKSIARLTEKLDTGTAEQIDKAIRGNR
jgi:uncharacterized protein YprB with RNaseH-like and TPR domain